MLLTRALYTVFPTLTFSATRFQAAKDIMSCAISEFRYGVRSALFWDFTQPKVPKER